MKKIDEGEFLTEEEDVERLGSSEEKEAAQVKQVTPQQSSGSTGSDESDEVVEQKTVAVAATRPLEIEDYDLLEGTPPVSPCSAEKLAYTHRQSSMLITDAIALVRRAQRERVERRITNIASKCRDG
ncbi:hypothetical protein PHYSODRAFT_296271 [Phytophthora sojae]|uniref:Uncharacterized protein n=1 Tax=Phytophthora sojae (strain P6497) TaxID=1094619 RepID=G4YRM5_PHYSP|nr:hypothetical protein PHYSODRAFT_296271 [Phytophthora sojae]EGZ24066.1 hypothetical protein PHYSODRAFT_296271 [Phytophthora sojae]|eukprot:XP_009519354.1 hypothetical protein PHYSODRAFT_296271 [Phytophthora sojae]